MLPAIIASVGLPFLIRILSDGLKQSDNKIATEAASALDKVGDAIDSGAFDVTESDAVLSHIEKMASLQSAEIQKGIEQVNETARIEVASNDAYVRRMRPTFGYLMALTWTAQMLALAYVIVFEPARASEVLQATGSLSAIWGIGLSVLGIYVYKRSEEKTRKF